MSGCSCPCAVQSTSPLMYSQLIRAALLASTGTPGDAARQKLAMLELERKEAYFGRIRKKWGGKLDELMGGKLTVSHH